ncbi:MAG TPA: Asp23/Gls24 family envelope stress response protein [Thermotogaceae bacterium]|nr:Asp23/Gls24 family envelope stress response protein [Thermotogaceae bacterium]
MDEKRISGEYGDINIADNVILDIATVALSKVEDIYVDDRKNIKKLKKNISVQHDVEGEEERLVINVKVNVRYGRSLIDVAKDIQKTLKEEVQNLTGIEVNEVNVKVEDIIFEEPQNIENLDKEIQENLGEIVEQSNNETEENDNSEVDDK